MGLYDVVEIDDPRIRRMLGRYAEEEYQTKYVLEHGYIRVGTGSPPYTFLSSVHLFPPLSVGFHPSSGRRSPPTLGDGTSRYKVGQTRKIKITHHKEHIK